MNIIAVGLSDDPFSAGTTPPSRKATVRSQTITRQDFIEECRRSGVHDRSSRSIDGEIAGSALGCLLREPCPTVNNTAKRQRGHIGLDLPEVRDDRVSARRPLSTQSITCAVPAARATCWLGSGACH